MEPINASAETALFATKHLSLRIRIDSIDHRHVPSCVKGSKTIGSAVIHHGLCQLPIMLR